MIHQQRNNKNLKVARFLNPTMKIQIIQTKSLIEKTKISNKDLRKRPQRHILRALLHMPQSQLKSDLMMMMIN